MKSTTTATNTIESIAVKNKLDLRIFTRFALSNLEKFGVTFENSIPVTAIWFVNDLLKEFKKLSRNALHYYSRPHLIPVDLIGLNVMGWSPTVSDDGIVIWSNDDVSDTVIFASPNWNTDGMIPFEVNNLKKKSDEGKFILNLNINSDNVPLELQKDFYVNTLQTIINQI